MTILEKGEHYPQNDDILNRLLNAYVATDQTDKARSNFKRAIERNPDNKVYRYNYGSLLLQAREYDTAIQQLERAVEIDSTYAAALYNLGVAYQNKAFNFNDQIGQLMYELRQDKAHLSDVEIEERQQKIDQLRDKQQTLFRSLFERAIPPLEKARKLVEQRGEDLSDVCRALFQAYAFTNQPDKAKEAANCAGIDGN